jgi:hypothetical protein
MWATSLLFLEAHRVGHPIVSALGASNSLTLEYTQGPGPWSLGMFAMGNLADLAGFNLLAPS